LQGRTIGVTALALLSMQSSLAKLALQLGDPNCTAIFVPDKNILMPKGRHSGARSAVADQ
jgi:hypothetical protein